MGQALNRVGGLAIRDRSPEARPAPHTTGAAGTSSQVVDGVGALDDAGALEPWAS